MSFDPLELKRISPIPGSEIAPQGSPPAHIPERIPELLPLSTLLVPTLVINEGESNTVVLYRIKEHVKRLTAAHNELIERLEENEFAEQGIFLDESKQFTEDDCQKLITRYAKKPNQTYEVVGWLFAIRYTCNCVTTGPLWSGRYAFWCTKCNRLILEND